MGDTASRAKVSVALVGVGPTWELHYREAIQRLSSKLSVRAVCDSVAMRAAAVADEFETAPVCSPWLLTRRTDLHAWLILDPGWFGPYPADLAVRHGRPALLANTFQLPTSGLLPILQRSLDRGESLMPEFPQRFTPATTRLRELMATRLGRVRRIELEVPLQPVSPETVTCWLHDEPAEAIGLFDWCACLICEPCTDVEFRKTSSGARLDLTFRKRTGGPGPDITPGVAIQFAPTASGRRRIECDLGSAVISGPRQIAWQTAAESAEETLSDERSPYEVILDQFCRRALGGLLPAPSVNHALRAISIARLAADAVARSTRS